MTRNEELASFILSGSHDAQEWREFARTHSFIRVKQLPSSNSIQFNLSGQSGWFYPADWLINYQNSCIERADLELDRLFTVLPQDEVNEYFAKYYQDESTQLPSIDELIAIAEEHVAEKPWARCGHVFEALGYTRGDIERLWNSFRK